MLAGHRGNIIIINQTSRRIPVFVIVIPVGITLCILLGMNCIADDYRGNGQDSGNYQKRDQNCGHCRNNSAPRSKGSPVFIESIFEYEEEHRKQFKHANKVCFQRHPAHGIHSGNCRSQQSKRKIQPGIHPIGDFPDSLSVVMFSSVISFAFSKLESER